MKNQGTDPRAIKIEVNQSGIPLFAVLFNITNASGIKIDKLSESITDAVFERYKAHKEGINTGIKPSKPFTIRVSVNNLDVANTGVTELKVGAQGDVKIDTKLYKKHPDTAKTLFSASVFTVISVCSGFNLGVVDCF